MACRNKAVYNIMPTIHPFLLVTMVSKLSLSEEVACKFCEEVEMGIEIQDGKHVRMCTVTTASFME